MPVKDTTEKAIYSNIPWISCLLHLPRPGHLPRSIHRREILPESAFVGSDLLSTIQATSSNTTIHTLAVKPGPGRSLSFSPASCSLPLPLCIPFASSPAVPQACLESPKQTSLLWSPCERLLRLWYLLFLHDFLWLLGLPSLGFDGG